MLKHIYFETIILQYKSLLKNIKNHITYKINKFCIKMLKHTYFETEILF